MKTAGVCQEALARTNNFILKQPIASFLKSQGLLFNSKVLLLSFQTILTIATTLLSSFCQDISWLLSPYRGDDLAELKWIDDRHHLGKNYYFEAYKRIIDCYFAGNMKLLVINDRIEKI